MDRVKTIKDTVNKIILSSEVTNAIAQIGNYDPSLLFHCNDVAVIAGLMAQELGLPEKTIKEVIKGALVHDYGKTYLLKSLLYKIGPLTKEEYSTIREHPSWGKEYLKDEPNISDTVIDIVWHHHETENGTGYPDGCTQMRLETKIVAMADAFNAITSYRIYRDKEMNKLNVFRTMEDMSKRYSDGNLLLNVLLNIAYTERV